MNPALPLAVVPLAAALALAAVTPAPKGSPTPTPPAVEVKLPVAPFKAKSPEPAVTAVFSHVVHTERRLKLKCVDCHLLGVDGNRFRPTDTKACAQCHKGDGLIEKFVQSIAARPPRVRSGPVEPIHRIHQYYDCSRCHGPMTLSQKIGDFPLPPVDNSDESCVQCHSRAVQFSHALHVAVDGKVGADCGLCHTARPDGIQYGVPGHPQCWTCHDINLLGLVEGCNLCHLTDTRAPKTYNLERASTLHKLHPRATGAKIECQACHDKILTATSLDEVRAARASAAEDSCKRCHATPR